QASTAELKRDLEEQKIAAVTEIQKRLDKMIKKGEATNAQIRQMQTELRSKQEQAERIFQVKQSKADQETSEQIQRIQNDSAKLVTDQQNAFKAAAVALPCIPPLLVGLIVFFSRRLKERDNIAKVRLK
ncbi:MAG: ABC transporter permease, partial [Planctomycetota bacterium]